MPPTLLVTNTLDQDPRGGRELLCKLNFDILADLFNGSLVVLELERRAVSSLGAAVAAFKGRIDGVNSKSIVDCLELIGRDCVDTVFIDGSNLGELASCIKKAYPEVKIYSFFHNVETRFFLGNFRRTKAVRAAAVLLANFVAERKTVKYSDVLITLSQRDSDLLKKWFGRPADFISPMAMSDQFSGSNDGSAVAGGFALFVGGSFYANREGIRWYAENVAPFVEIKTMVVGRGMEADRKLLAELSGGQVVVVGGVDDLQTWYKAARVVIAPIFDGSGMKTKVAEGLMYGKRVFGTPEAFSGYEKFVDTAGVVCSDAEEFIDALNSVDALVSKQFDNECRQAYVDSFSYSAALERFRKLLILRL